jgi:hypothetical protein
MKTEKMDHKDYVAAFFNILAKLGEPLELIEKELDKPEQVKDKFSAYEYLEKAYPRYKLVMSNRDYVKFIHNSYYYTMRF